MRLIKIFILLLIGFISTNSFSQTKITNEICKHIPAFIITYVSDYRQAIAESWPQSIDDIMVQNDWGRKPAFNLSTMTNDMFANIKK